MEVDETDKKALVKQAEAAARRGDAVGMVNCLFKGKTVDLLVWKVGQEYYGKLASEEIRDCVAEAVAACYASLASGKSITNLVGYLLRAARNIAIDLVAEFESNGTRDAATIPDWSDPAGDAARDAARMALRHEALERARSLLPQLGQENIRRVMEVVFDAVEKEIVDLSDQNIAEITGIQPETVRRLKNRGFERLRRLATDNGFNLTIYRRAIGQPESSTVAVDTWFSNRSEQDE
ncbi:sigma-70 family RNA polymerase sigma factor [Achromobacter xylosoxidans]|uniref:sigma-70 family RNA polymerase sigma factor n=1 Tax=Alcaligenes xylosoxydans xylosoxydans TaxID=85698 RepID=UPI0022B8B281|nr:sigma-70 family RNA polymerase sigma factor [Achromobacter xylosoxidans]MCZ8391586.1 sigma-70 family RNA polymerase sigma factor [Achromobacter xylosoxidans]